MQEADSGGWETVTDPTEIQQVLGKQGANKVLGLTAGGPGSGGGKAATEGERKAAFLATRVAGNIATLNTISKDAQRPSLFSSFVGAINETAGNYVKSADRQRAEAAQTDLLDAALTLGTGAAYNQEQLTGYRKAYFPQLGDSDSVIAEKRERLRLLLESSRVGAGSAAPQIDAALKAAGFPVSGSSSEEAKGGDRASGGVGASSPGAPPSSPGPSDGDLVVSQDGSQAFETDRDKAFGVAIQSAFDGGASKAELDAIAVQWGFPRYGADLDRAVAYRDKGGKGARILPPKTGYQGPTALGTLAASDVGSFFIGAGNAVTGNSLDDIVELTGGDGARAREAIDVARDANPIPSFFGEATGAALGVAGLTRATGATARAANIGYGAIYGSGDEEAPLTGAALGAGTAYLGDRLFSGIASRLSRPRAPNPDRMAAAETLAAADRIGVTPLAADVGGTMTRRLTGAAGQGPVSAVPIVRRAQQVTAEAQAARDRIADSIGQVLEPEGAGNAARAGAEMFIGRTGRQARGLYDAAERMAQGVDVPLTNARATLQRNLQELAGTPGGSEAQNALQVLNGELDGAFSVSGIRRMRTTLRERFVGEGLRGSDLERRVNQVIDAANQDITDGLRAAGRENAASAFQAADRYWRARVQTIDNVLEPILGKNNAKSGEEIVQAIMRDARGNNARLRSFVRALPADEQATVRATVISQLGRASPGTQDAAGQAFSLPQFLTHWNQLSPGAKRTLFGDESGAALNDLARVAQGSREAQRFQNFSNTAGGIAGQVMLTGGLGVTGGLPGLIVGSGAQYLSGRLLASPRFARWLARAPRTQIAPPAYIERLSRIAAAEPAIAQDALGLQQRLLTAFQQTPQRAAASDVTPAQQEQQ